jgi:DNA-binding beta-propeller fold protein YncE
LDYKVKISSIVDTTVFGISNAEFTIAPFVPSITVTVPNGGETWQAGTTEIIKWTDNIDENVRIELYKASVLNSLIIESTNSDGSKIWDIPPGLIPDTNYTVKIISVADTTVFGFSDADFTISEYLPGITVTSPNGGESWQSGIEQTIEWIDNITENVKIDLYNGGVFQTQLFASTFSDGSKFWTIPLETLPDSDYTIKITSVDDEIITDVSDANFSITAVSFITVTIPNGGESWQSGTAQTITWTDNIAENVKIELFKGGNLNYEIVTSTASDDTYIWNIPGATTPDTKYIIKISSVNDANIFDISDANFSIFAASDINIDPTSFVFNVLIDDSDTDVMTIYNTAPAGSQNLIWDIIEQEIILSVNSEVEIPIILKKSQVEFSSQMGSNDNELQRNINNFIITSSIATNSSWLSESPVNGSISPGDSQNVEIMVDAAGLAAGTYNSDLMISSNDPDEPQLVIPVELNVLPPQPIGNEIGIVTNVVDRSIHIVDVQSNSIAGPFLAGQLGTGFLLDAVITPNQQLALISNLQDNAIYFVDLSTLSSPSVIGTIDLGFRPEDIALACDGSYAIVSTDYQSRSNLAVIDVVNRSLIQSINISPRNAQAVDIGADGTVLIADFYDSKIHTMLLNLSNGILTDLNSFIEVGIEPINISTSPDGQTAIVANIGGNSLSVLRINSPGNVTLSKTISGMSKPQSIAFDHNSQRAFVVQSGTSPDQVVVLNVSSPDDVTDTGIRIPLLSNSTSGYFGVDVIGISSDDQYGYVGNPSSGVTSNSISIVDLNNYTLTGSLICDNYPLSVSLPKLTEMHTISGYVRDGSNIGVEGVAITFSNGEGDATTNSSGYYSKNVLDGYSGTATPNLSGWVFNPQYINYNNVTSNQTNQNYSGSKGLSSHFTTIWTGNPYLSMNFYITSASLDGIDLEAGDEIGIFDGEYCVGMGMLTESIPSGGYLNILASTDDPGKAGIDGFIIGNPITYKFWDSNNAIEIQTVTPSYSSPPGGTNFISQGTAVLDLLGAITSITQITDFSSGWNIFSLMVAPTDPDMLQLLNPLITAGILVKVQDEAGHAVEELPPPIGWVNNIGNHLPTEGYYLKVNSEATLNVTGSPINLPLDISLTNGWNLISYPVSIPQNALTVVQPLITSGVLVKIQDEAGNAIEELPAPIGWVNNIGNFQAGEGYYLKVNANSTLTIDEPVTLAKGNILINEQTTSKHFNLCYTGNPYAPMNIYISRADLASGSSLSAGDEIGIFDGENCVGAILLTDPIDLMDPLAMIASKDDPTTQEVDGFVEGNSISYKFWISTSSTEFDQCVEHNTLGNGTFISQGTAMLEITSILPVELTSFIAVVEKEKVILKWETATEVNNYGFEILRFTQNDKWGKIGFVDGHGNSNSPKEYSFTDKNLTGGSHFSYRLKQVDIDGSYEYSDIVEVEFVPTEFALYQNYPNPFNPSTKIKYSLPQETAVTIKVFDILGEEVMTLVNEKQEAGTYEIDFDGGNLVSGIYVYQMQAGSFSNTKKMLLMK